jgi:uncharacterized protein YqeY
MHKKTTPMSLEQKINDGIKVAMKAKNEPELRSLRAVKAAILLAKTSGEHPDGLGEADEIKLLQKLVKQRRDSLEIYRAQGREDLASKEEEEIAVIDTFLPSQMDDDALKAALRQIIAQVGAQGPSDMGKVMGRATKELAGKADGKRISALVREMLQG